jgi:hypothetical protein
LGLDPGWIFPRLVLLCGPLCWRLVGFALWLRVGAE